MLYRRVASHRLRSKVRVISCELCNRAGQVVVRGEGAEADGVPGEEHEVERSGGFTSPAKEPAPGELAPGWRLLRPRRDPRGAPFTRLPPTALQLLASDGLRDPHQASAASPASCSAAVPSAPGPSHASLISALELGGRAQPAPPRMRTRRTRSQARLDRHFLGDPDLD
ncbi:hypothetical protein PAL_GLEAN10014662 [Pteropus alecto]|uniref:Uncharacterized protein n=1 Tax=Pteropus alecto TaxID=9402 RepID=L5KL91_PTEAL|nr:hypothetical protein PAL_GLEAN10014662 [Pteropus alecto]